MGVNILFNGLLNILGFVEFDFLSLKMLFGGGMVV